MAFIDMRSRAIQAKIVYYGPGWGGKTTNLEYIHKRLKSQTRSEMVSINTTGDRTIFFDFLPLEIGTVRGFNLRIQLYTVPGQPHYNATRRLVLNGADGVVFVADSRCQREEHNKESLEDLKRNLLTYGRNIRDVPLVLQFNKRDLSLGHDPIMSLERMEQGLNGVLKAPCTAASALNGDNVLDTLKMIIRGTVRSLKNMTG